jgi:hypothetical protein
MGPCNPARSSAKTAGGCGIAAVPPLVWILSLLLHKPDNCEHVPSRLSVPWARRKNFLEIGTFLLVRGVPLLVNREIHEGPVA